MDTTYNNGKFVATDLKIALGAYSTGDAYDLSIQADGRILAAGTVLLNTVVNKVPSSQANFVLLRYNTNGTLDSGFGRNGIATTDFYNLSNDLSAAVAIQPDGKAVMGGVIFYYDSNNVRHEGIGVSRYLP